MDDKKKPYDKDTVNLYPDFYPKTRHWSIDQDYFDKLNYEEKVWMSKFLTEYYKGSTKKDSAEALHNTPELRKRTYKNNNAMARDLYSLLDCAGLLVRLGAEDAYDVEERLITAIDRLYSPRLRVVREGDSE